MRFTLISFKFSNLSLVLFFLDICALDRLEVSGKLDWEKARFQLKVIKSQLVALGLF
jgi:hypothetical protein